MSLDRGTEAVLLVEHLGVGGVSLVGFFASAQSAESSGRKVRSPKGYEIDVIAGPAWYTALLSPYRIPPRKTVRTIRKHGKK